MKLLRYPLYLKCYLMVWCHIFTSCCINKEKLVAFGMDLLLFINLYDHPETPQLRVTQGFLSYSGYFYSNVMPVASAQLNSGVRQYCRKGEPVCGCLYCPIPPIYISGACFCLDSLKPEDLTPRFELTTLSSASVFNILSGGT